MVFVNIDAPGNAVNRRGVRAIQKASGAAARQAAAQARRDSKAAKRARGPNVIILSKMPRGNPPGVCQTDPEGAYVWGGGESTEGRYQIVVVGELRGPIDGYRAALAKWLGKPMQIVEVKPLERPDPDEFPDKAFLSIILEPGA
jgi:hypothetical protein